MTDSCLEIAHVLATIGLFRSSSYEVGRSANDIVSMQNAASSFSFCSTMTLSIRFSLATLRVRLVLLSTIDRPTKDYRSRLDNETDPSEPRRVRAPPCDYSSDRLQLYILFGHLH